MTSSKQPCWRYCEACGQHTAKAQQAAEVSLLTNDKLDDLWQQACRDDWHLRLVGSDIRGLIAEIKRLRTEPAQYVPVSLTVCAAGVVAGNVWEDKKRIAQVVLDSAIAQGARISYDNR